MNATKTTLNDVVLTVLSRTYGGFGYKQTSSAHDHIMAVLQDAEQTSEGLYGDDTTRAAEEVRQTLWSAYTGGGASAGATCNLFYALGRQDELGWVAGEASYPTPYGEREYNWFLEDLTEDQRQALRDYAA